MFFLQTDKATYVLIFKSSMSCLFFCLASLLTDAPWKKFAYILRIDKALQILNWL
jgi:hypothetical protein